MGHDDRHDNEHEALMEALFERRLDADETARLLGGVAGDEIEELAELVATLERIDPTGDEPSAADFAAMRSGVRRTLEGGNVVSLPTSQGPASPARWWPLAAALAAFAVGLGLGRTDAPAPAAEPLTLAEFVAASADDPATPFRYTNLQLDELDGDRVALRVALESDLELVRPKNDALVTEILAGSLVGDAPLDARLDIVRHAQGSHPRLRRALIQAATGDPNVSVRLKALQRLVAEAPLAADTQETLLAVLENDTSVAMRLIAVESLDEALLGDEFLDTLATPATGEDAVLWHARQRLNRNSL